MIKEKIERHMKALQEKHDILDKEIKDAFMDNVGDLEIEKMKKQKLRMKDEIESCKKQISELWVEKIESRKNDIVILITNHLSLKQRKKEKRKKVMTNLKQWLLGMIIIFVVLPIKVTLEFVKFVLIDIPMMAGEKDDHIHKW
jgi:hypothetical protein